MGVGEEKGEHPEEREDNPSQGGQQDSFPFAHFATTGFKTHQREGSREGYACPYYERTGGIVAVDKPEQSRQGHESPLDHQ